MAPSKARQAPPAVEPHGGRQRGHLPVAVRHRPVAPTPRGGVAAAVRPGADRAGGPPLPDSGHSDSGFTPGSGAPGAVASEQFVQALGVHRLDQVVVEARLAGAAQVVLLAVAGQGHQQGPIRALQLPEPPGHLVAVHARQPDVEEDHVGRVGDRRLERGRAVVGELGLVAAGPEQPGQEPGPVDVVVHDEHPFRGRVDRLRPGRSGRSPSCGAAVGERADGEADDELAAAPTPSLEAATLPPCSSTRRRTRVRPIPSPPWLRSSDRSAWVNRSKTRGSSSGAIPMPVSRTRTTASSPSRPASSSIRPPGSVYLAALFSRLARTCSSRAASASRGIGLVGQRRPTARGGGTRSAAGPSRRRGRRPSRRSTRPLAELDLAAADPGDVEQVVDQPGEVPDLPLGDRPGPARPRRRRGRPGGACAGRSGAAPGGCAARGPASPGTRPCGGRPRGSRGRAARCR